MFSLSSAGSIQFVGRHVWTTQPVLKNIHVHVDVNKLLHFLCLLVEPPNSGPFTLMKSDLLMYPNRGLVRVGIIISHPQLIYILNGPQLIYVLNGRVHFSSQLTSLLSVAASQVTSDVTVIFFFTPFSIKN